MTSRIAWFAFARAPARKDFPAARSSDAGVWVIGLWTLWARATEVPGKPTLLLPDSLGKACDDARTGLADVRQHRVK